MLNVRMFVAICASLGPPWRSQYLPVHMLRHAWLVVAATVIVVAPAYAATISISDLGDGSPVVTFSDFPSGFVLFAPCVFASEEVSCVLSFSGPAAPNAAFFGAINLYEDVQLTTLSDTLDFVRSINDSVEFFQFSFRSDSAGEISPRLGNTPIFEAMETGAPQSFVLPSFCDGCADITVILASDRDGASVPEPATLALFGLGLAGMGLSARRLQRNKKT